MAVPVNIPITFTSRSGSNKHSIEDVLNRMYNWKMESAFEYAGSIPDFPQKALTILKSLSEKFGNCGWQHGKAYDDLRKKNNIVADILGYEWNDDIDNWIKK